MHKVSQIGFLAEYMKMLPPENKIIIFGAGENGIKLSELIEESGRSVDAFCDNNDSKIGSYVNDIFCISYQELKKYKDNSIIFVSPNNAQEIYKQLAQDMFSNVVSEAIRSVLFFLPTEEITLAPVGHFYSLYPDFKDIQTRRTSIFNKNKEVKDIFFNEEHQCELLEKMKKYYDTLPNWERYGSKKINKYGGGEVYAQ